MRMYVAINIIYAQIPHLLKFESNTFSPSYEKVCLIGVVQSQSFFV